MNILGFYPEHTLSGSAPCEDPLGTLHRARNTVLSIIVYHLHAVNTLAR